MTTEIATTTPDKLLQLAVDKEASLDKLEKLLDLKERWEANEARKAYTVAMAEFKKSDPKILKLAKVDFTSSKGRTNYDYAKLANCNDVIIPAMSKCGLSHSWIPLQEGDSISVTCRITHVMGHFEETTIKGPPDTTGNKNSLQAINSTISYLERYTLLAGTGLATHDQDNDGRGSETERITEEQVNTLDALIKENGLSDDYKTRLLKFVEADSLEEIPAKKFKIARGEISRAIDRKKEAEEEE